MHMPDVRFLGLMRRPLSGYARIGISYRVLRKHEAEAMRHAGG